MNATTTSFSAGTRFAAPLASPRKLIRGVCAEIAERAGVAVWMPRAAFIVFGLLHWFLAIVLYIVLVKIMSPVRQRRFARPQQQMPSTGPVRDRLSALDARLAELEAATLQQESSLRRQFRDLERG